MLEEYEPDILACSETWMTDKCQKETLENECYVFHSRHKPLNWPGAQGVGFFIKRTLNWTERPDLDHKGLMNVCIEVRRTNCKPVIISCLYRHFSTKFDWYHHLEENVKLLDNNKTQCIITGDFNIDVLKAKESKKLLDLMQDYGFRQTINSPTRITQNSSTCIDLTFSNIEKYTSGVACVSVADHLMNYIVLGTTNSLNTHHYVTTRKFKNLNSEKLVSELSKVPWPGIR